MYEIIFIHIMLTNDPYEYVLFLDVIVHIYAEKPNKFKYQMLSSAKLLFCTKCFKKQDQISSC